ncbi:sugar phosphate isomerase/epimerase [Candidatus Poribacteria bacterium]|nr:sugar phosphate isomerase/epimerase [Candidatus Poribacteria bacterium]
MKIAYAFRRCTFYPHQGTGLPENSGDRRKFLAKVKEIGFDGIELGAMGASEDAIKTLRAELEDAGTPCVAIRGGGGAAHPRVAAANKKRLENAVHFAAQIGAGVVNSTVTTPPAFPDNKGTFKGENVSQGASRTAREEDYERTAKAITDVAKIAAELGVEISIEIHQNSIVDNSWSALHLMELIDQPNVGLNPDLGNIYWTYHIPEESCEDAIVALAPHANYWHCKSLSRVDIPELERSIFLQVPLPDGEIDYRFAISAMLAADYKGYIAIEGMRLGDQFHNDAKTVAYVKSLLAELSG